MLPAKTRDYLGPITNTKPWDDFSLRPGDIVLSTPPKCGTTWSQAMLMMLIHGEAVHDRDIWRTSLWLDCAFRDQVEIAAKLDAQTHRRCIKSHTPMDGIAYDPEAIYFAVYRHPIDVHFSMQTHVSNMEADFMDYLIDGDTETLFERFLTAPSTDTGTDDLSLAAIIHHYESFAKWAHLPNVHLFHYADLKADHPGQIARYAELTGIEASPDLVTDIAQATGFSAMKTVTAQVHERADGHKAVFRNEADFFAEGTSNKWVGKLDDTQVKRFQSRLKELVPDPTERAWLQDGSQPA